LPIALEVTTVGKPKGKLGLSLSAAQLDAIRRLVATASPVLTHPSRAL
jgi:hypothetical protein